MCGDGRTGSWWNKRRMSVRACDEMGSDGRRRRCKGSQARSKDKSDNETGGWETPRWVPAVPA